MPLTVSQIAERMGASGADRTALIERLRHWTREGLLAPIGDRNPGTGRHRTYDESILDEVAILNALADQGIDVAAQREFIGVLNLTKGVKSSWRRKAEQGIDLYLEISKFPKEARVPARRGVFLREGKEDLIHPAAELSLVFNLTKLLERVDRKRDHGHG